MVYAYGEYYDDRFGEYRDTNYDYDGEEGAYYGDHRHHHMDDDDDEFDRFDDDDDHHHYVHDDDDDEIHVVFDQQHLNTSFRDSCAKLARNDPEMTYFSDPLMLLDDALAMQLGRALVGNTHLTELTLHPGPGVTERGANALVQGILGSKITSLELNPDDELPLHLVQLYTQTIHMMETLNLTFPMDDGNAATLGGCLSGNQSVQYLFLEVKKLTPRGARSIANGIRNSRIQTLDLTGYHGNISSKAIKILLLQGVKECATIQNLQWFGFTANMKDLSTVLPKLGAITISSDTRMSVANVQLLGHGLSQADNLTWLRILDGNLGDDHMRILAPILGHHPALEHMEVRINEFTDAAMAMFVEHWQRDSKIQQLSLEQNKIGPIGVQRLIRATADHPNLVELELAGNKDIGYDGLKLIGQELAGKKFFKLNLLSVAKWIDYDDVTCDTAVEQESKRAQACKALLQGMRSNVYLQDLNVQGMNFPENVTSELDVYVKANKCGRMLLLEQDQEPPAFWCHFLAKQKEDTNLLFLFLRELPTVTKTDTGVVCI